MGDWQSRDTVKLGATKAIPLNSKTVRIVARFNETRNKIPDWITVGAVRSGQLSLLHLSVLLSGNGKRERLHGRRAAKQLQDWGSHPRMVRPDLPERHTPAATAPVAQG